MDANFTPNITPYNYTGCFRYWCQHVLPLVYDDSLSYYELLCKVVNYLNSLIKNTDGLKTDIDNLLNSFNKLQDYVNSYFDNLDIQEEINQKLDKMASDGTLANLINDTIFSELNDRIQLIERPPLSKLCTGFTSFNKGYSVIKNRNALNLSISLELNVTTTPYDETGLLISQTYTVVIDEPVDRFNFSGVGDSYECQLINVNYTKNTITFRVLSVKQLTNQNVTFRIEGAGRLAQPISVPSIYSDKGNEVVEVVKTYWQAKQAGRKFDYGINFTYYGGQNIVNNNAGAARMECDTLVCMTLMGIPYGQSPYANTDPSYTYDFSQLIVNPTGNYDWAIENLKNDPVYGGRLTTTSSMNWYFWGNGEIFNDVNSLKNGDIAIFRRDNSTFDYVGHCGVIEIVNENGNDVPYLYHVSVAEYTEGEILTKVKLSDFYKYGRYYPEDTYFWRKQW